MSKIRFSIVILFSFFILALPSAAIANLAPGPEPTLISPGTLPPTKIPGTIPGATPTKIPGTIPGATPTKNPPASPTPVTEIGEPGATGIPTVIATVSPDDSDGDGLKDQQEDVLKTNPHDPDTDRDGALDGIEFKVYGTSPLIYDCDGDGVGDGDEAKAGLNPLTGIISETEWQERLAKENQ